VITPKSRKLVGDWKIEYEDIAEEPDPEVFAELEKALIKEICG